MKTNDDDNNEKKYTHQKLNYVKRFKFCIHSQLEILSMRMWHVNFCFFLTRFFFQIFFRLYT